MIKNYSHLNTHEIEYLWIIENFTDFFKYVKNGKYIKSTKFDVDGNKERRFHLEMDFESEYISFNCQSPKESCKDMIMVQISIMDKNNEKFKTIDVEIDPKGDNDKEKSTLKIKKYDLFLRSLDLFPDNNLKVLCNLKIFVNFNHNDYPFNIRKKHQSMRDHFKKLLDSQVGTDVVFEVDEQEFKVHKSIMMARSPVFLAMFNNDMIENNSNRVKIEDMSSSVFELLIEFIYTDEITTELDVETGMDLLKAASKYQLERLETLCEAELCALLTVNNVMDILLIAETYNCTDLEDRIENFIKIHQKEIQSIVKPEHFVEHPHHVSLFVTQTDA